MRPLAAVLLALPLLASCREHTVAVTFRPEIDATYRYEVTVTSRSETRLQGEEPDVREDRVVLQSQHTVLEAGPSGVLVRVVLAQEGTVPRAFVVRFDRAAQLESVEAVEGPTGDAAGGLGISEIFPTAASAPPDRRLQPGDRWEVDDAVVVPGSDGPARLRGEGRLVELGVVDGREVARLASRATLRTSSSAATGDLSLNGEQVIHQRATYDLADGSVRSARSTTVGHYDVEVLPPVGTGSDAVRGTLAVRVTSTTERLG
jgi:hypothetical protein